MSTAGNTSGSDDWRIQEHTGGPGEPRAGDTGDAGPIRVRWNPERARWEHAGGALPPRRQPRWFETWPRRRWNAAGGTLAAAALLATTGFTAWWATGHDLPEPEPAPSPSAGPPDGYDGYDGGVDGDGADGGTDAGADTGADGGSGWATDTPTDPAVDAAAQAAALEELLLASGQSRQTVIDAVAVVGSCPSVGEVETAAAELYDAAMERYRLRDELLVLDLSALPDHQELTDALYRAWSSSGDADYSYALWADSRASSDCAPSTSAEESGDAAAAAADSEEAAAAKDEALALWNPIAEEYGLTTLGPEEI
ncbi:hypothetical protein [Allostreptomyces psammosilenae]|uniref:Uncharacterized protein n=1 Tax=Allostreptomyces psammosilenae TaxID=1892865 RepID=A0A853A0S3_9ACTN|nr:hypothetical protein [Allostreptomyces psammosilenae]NYI07985.1 hypothetical protein [Allostreptomyces psammosilenae]